MNNGSDGTDTVTGSSSESNAARSSACSLERSSRRDAHFLHSGLVSLLAAILSQMSLSRLQCGLAEYPERFLRYELESLRCGAAAQATHAAKQRQSCISVRLLVLLCSARGADGNLCKLGICGGADGSLLCSVFSSKTVLVDLAF